MRRVTALTSGLVATAAIAGACVVALASPGASTVQAVPLPATQSSTPAMPSPLAPGPVGTEGVPSAAPVAAASPSSTPAPVTPAAEVLAAKKSIISGVSTGGLGALDDFVTTTKTRPAIYSMFEQWSNNRTLAGTEAAGARLRGMTPSIAWEPWDARFGVNQPRYQLQTIIEGQHDAYLASFADSVRDFGDPVIIRLMHEGNGDWYPWGADVNGNSPQEYVAAWRHVVDLFRARGVTNVVWEWAPNISSAHTSDVRSLYPGDDYVDQVGLSGYNWTGDQDFDGVFRKDLKTIGGLTNKKIWISETGSGPDDSKARWIQDLYAGIARYPQVVGFVWFDHKLDNGQDWRIATSPAAVQAWQEGARANLG